MNNNLAIIGAGGFAREVECWAKLRYACTFYVEDEYANGKIRPLSEFDPTNSRAIIAIADPNTRRRIAESMPKETIFTSLVHPTVNILDPETVLIMRGVIICAGVTLTTNIIVRDHVHLNLNTTVGHDCELGRYLTTAPAVNISGNVKTGSNVYIGTNTSIREKVEITSNVTVGMGAVVLNDIKQPGTYVGLVKQNTKKAI